MSDRSIARRIENERGFTLVEMLIVITVLGILSGIAVIVVGNARGDSVVSACKTDFKSIELSAEGVHSKTGDYPALAGDLLSSAGKGGVLRELPSTTNYQLEYEKVTTPEGFRIWVRKPDSTPLSGPDWDVNVCEGLA